MNYFMYDVLASSTAFLLFPLVFVFPGYVIATLANIFGFGQRRIYARLAIAIVISFAISPVFLFWVARFSSIETTLATLGGIAVIFTLLVIPQSPDLLNQLRANTPGPVKTLRWVAAGWSLFAILFLVDLQFGQNLYFSAVSYDLTTRVSIVDAISRTGVPPISPGYFFGESMRLNFLYYFWYIPGSSIEILGGDFIDARHAMIASIAWCGVGFLALIALYIHFRDRFSPETTLKRTVLGISFLTISGLDAYPALLFMIGTRVSGGSMWPEGDIEHWNEQITAWVSALAWVPHHVASLIACLAAFLLIETARSKPIKERIVSACLAGIALASAAGLSIWMTLAFALFWGLWLFYLAFFRRDWASTLILIVAGMVGLVAISPFFMGILESNGLSSGQGGFPLGFRVRVFRPANLIANDATPLGKNLINLAFLPLNYFMELGFFLVAAIHWLKKERKNRFQSSWAIPEILLLASAVFIGTFITSTLIYNNDLGWRSWMFGQFVMLIWAVDIAEDLLRQNPLKVYLNSKSRVEPIKTGRLLASLALFGVFTSLVSVIFLRTWPILIDLGVAGFPNQLSSDTHLGQRTFAARQAYEYIRDNTPSNSIVQYNPDIPIDRPSGLYGTRQMVISDHSAYGVPIKTILEMTEQVKAIFELNTASWDQIQRECQKFDIDFLIVRDLDPLWLNLEKIATQRAPVYQNERFAVLDCR